MDRWFSTLLGASAIVAASSVASTAIAHNAIVHRDMTDRAWHVMLALARDRLDLAGDADLTALASDAKRSIMRFGSLPAGLPPPKPVTCSDTAVIDLYSSSPSWPPAATFPLVPLGAVPYPIKTTYITGNDCGIDADWKPGVFFDTVNPPNGRSLIGVFLGFWAHQPDDEEGDFHTFLRPTNAAGLSQVKKYLETAAGAGAATVYVPLSCLIKCLGDFFGLGGSCNSCLDKAIADSQNAVHDAITGADGLIPGFVDHGSTELYTGMGHHLKVAPTGPPGPWKLNPGAFDDRPGLLIEDAGPIGVPDRVESVVLIAANTFGISVHYDASLGPKRYEIKSLFDFHPDSVPRTKGDWQWLSVAHTPFTPIDNLGAFGWKAFRENPRAHVPFLGWPLHAFGDATVPMHVAGAFGWGHRPYEDAFENRYKKYLYLEATSNAALAKQQALDIARRAVAWRRMVRDWRARHPQRGMDVPVRDMVTALAERTWNRVRGPSMFAWPFNHTQSSAWQVPGPTRSAALKFYELYPGADAINTDLLLEGIAAEVAFLISATEFLP